MGDRIQLQQVVVNLVVNAVQAVTSSMSADRRILIRTELSSELIHRSIEDAGPGIEPKHLSHVFNFFFNFFTNKDSGMGMGLPTSQSIVEAHGGSIEADNNSGLGGARFAFTLPAVTD